MLLYGAILTANWLHLIVSLSLLSVSPLLSHRLLQVMERYSQRISCIRVPSGISMEIKLTSWYVIILLHFAGEGGKGKDLGEHDESM